MTRQEQVIYAAGFFDGEGSVSIRLSHPRGVKTYSMRIMAGQIDKRPIELLVNLWGGSVSLDDRGERRPVWRWTLQAYQAEAALREMLPYLIVKRAQAEIAITFQGRRTKLNRSRKVRIANEPQNEIDRQALLAVRMEAA